MRLSHFGDDHDRVRVKWQPDLQSQVCSYAKMPVSRKEHSSQADILCLGNIPYVIWINYTVRYNESAVYTLMFTSFGSGISNTDPPVLSVYILIAAGLNIFGATGLEPVTS